MIAGNGSAMGLQLTSVSVERLPAPVVSKVFVKRARSCVNVYFRSGKLVCNGQVFKNLNI